MSDEVIDQSEPGRSTTYFIHLRKCFRYSGGLLVVCTIAGVVQAATEKSFSSLAVFMVTLMLAIISFGVSGIRAGFLSYKVKERAGNRRWMLLLGNILMVLLACYELSINYKFLVPVIVEFFGSIFK